MKGDLSSFVHHAALHRVSTCCNARFCCVWVALCPRMFWCGQPMACTQVGPSLAPHMAPYGHVEPLTRNGSTMSATKTMVAALVELMRPGCACVHSIAPGPR